MSDLLTANNPIDVFLAISIFLGILAVLVSIHEASHAWMANRLGDPTARYQGRVSLNPLVHIDPLGTVMLPLFLIVFSVVTRGPLFLFGWAKPTPFNPWNLQNPRRDSALISFAGPVSNFILAIILAIPFRLGLLTVPNNSLFSTNISLSGPIEIISLIVSITLVLSVILGIFNLIPIAPLDGFKVVTGLLPKNLALQWQQLERFGPFILIAVIFFGGQILSPIIFGILNLFLAVLIG